MPKGPYGSAYQRARAAMLATGAFCDCGAVATSLDHRPALVDHHHVEGSGCCVWVPACLECQHRQGGQIRARRRVPPPTRSW